MVFDPNHIEECKAIIGADNTCRLDSPNPHVASSLIASPQDLDSLQQLVQFAGKNQIPIYPCGGQSGLHLGFSSQQEGLLVSTQSLCKVIDYPSGDMTITARAGITIDELQRILAEQGQRLPIDVACSSAATLGGAIATNTSGPRRYGYGTLRDFVIGMTVLKSSGEFASAGGRVVKNVAGYDLCKLYVGSHGTLGIITQVTLKVRPVAERLAALVVPVGDAADVAATLDQLCETKTRPVCLEYFNHVAASALDLDDQRGFIVVFEDTGDSVEWQIEEIQSECISPGSIQIQSATESVDLMARVVNLHCKNHEHFGLKASVLPSRVIDMAEKVQQLPGQWCVTAHAGNGVIHASELDGIDLSPNTLKELQEVATEYGGNLVVPRCPIQQKECLQIWGAPRTDLPLMKRIRDQLDPSAILNPGRFLV